MEEGDVLLDTVSILVPTSSLMNNYRTMYSVFTSSVADTLWSLASPAYVQLAKEFPVKRLLVTLCVERPPSPPLPLPKQLKLASRFRVRRA